MKRYILGFVAVITVALPFFFYSSSLKARQDLNLMEKVILSVTSPVESVFAFFKVRVGGAIDNTLLLWDAKHEAAVLRQENAKLSVKLQIASELELENQRLRELLHFSERYNQDFLSARVLARDPSYFFDSLRIDRGADDGVRIGMAVVSANGAVGLVMKAASSSSHVLLVTDPNMSLDVIVARNRKRGVLQGMAIANMTLRHLGKGSRVQVGDQILSSGLTGSFPRGIPVGRVADIQLESDNVTQHIEVEPFVDFADLSEVLVLRNPNPEIDAIQEIGGSEWMDKIMHTGSQGGTK
jgi:rod shape-determining protein MreC